jgi:two-component system, chemotaxis family, sensor kinase CheA
MDDNTRSLAQQFIKEQENFMEEVDREFLNDFTLEANEHLENIELNLLSLETEPDNKETIHEIFRSFHTIKGLAGFVNLNIVREISHRTENLLDDCRKGNIKPDKSIIDTILHSSDIIKQIVEDISLSGNSDFIENVCNHMIYIENISQKDTESETEYVIDKIGKILLEQGSIDEENLEDILKLQKGKYPEMKIGQIAVKEKKTETKNILDALRKQKKADASSEIDDYIRIPASKADNLVDMMGELIIIQSLVEQGVNEYLNSNHSFIANIQRMARITRDVQNLSMSLRMVSLKSTFRKISRIARDAINSVGKDIIFKTFGDDTEIDRSVVDKLTDPLVHLVKNAISHGIEDRQLRCEKEKPVQGKVEINAYSRRGSVYIEVSDDGKGLDPEIILNKAIEKGIAEPLKEYGQREIFDFIFQPGLSTAEKIDTVSGRGVGMDVVKTEVTKIGGKVDIKSIKDIGSTFTLKIPINMAVISGIIVDIQNTKYIIPALNVKKILQPEEAKIISIKGEQTIIRDRDNLVPLINISEITQNREEVDDKKIFLVLELEQKIKALPVTNVIGKTEIVVKSLGEELSASDVFTGASILGDGKVALIIDVENLLSK